MRYLLKDGKIIDGTGRLAVEGDVLIDGEKIEDIGNLDETGDFQVIDCSGMIVCPGFIDVNNHSDTHWTLFDFPGQESLLTQGITTIIGGNCGSSLAPLITDEAIRSIQKYADISKAQVHWASFSEFLEFLDGLKLALNFGSLVGHSTLRRALAGDEIRQLREDELKMMIGGLDHALDQGALGLSTGLVYSHARVADKAEFRRLAEAVEKRGGIYATHIRQEGGELVNSIKEAIEVARKTGVSLQISHLKACGRKNWKLMDRALELIDEARNEGLEVNFDVYPYVETGSVLYILLPAWVAEGGKEALIKRLKNKATKSKVIEEMRSSDFDYGKIIIANSKLGRVLQHRRVSDMAKNQERSAEEVVVDLIVASDDRITTITEMMNPKNVEKAVAKEYAVVATNGAGYADSFRRSGNLVHPRCFGAMPKYLREYVFLKRTLTLEKAIRKITEIPAKKYGIIKQTGTLEKGKRADIAVFFQKELKDKASIENPFSYSEGIRELFVGGEQAIEGGKLTGKKAGTVFRGIAAQ
ncbi:MAG: amidohydrolase family protein [Patescibacteria group bacterium]|nr:amidohydrolase family protein [Patescibacteria group bacterium]